MRTVTSFSLVMTIVMRSAGAPSSRLQRDCEVLEFRPPFGAPYLLTLLAIFIFFVFFQQYCVFPFVVIFPSAYIGGRPL